MRMMPMLALAATTMAAGCAAPERRVIMATDPTLLAAEQAYGFADAVVVGDTVTLSGVIVIPRPGETGTQPAFDRVFAAIDDTLTRAGFTWADVVEIESYHADLPGQAQAIIAAKARYVKAPFPAWTAIQVTRFLVDGGVAEVKVTARKSKR